MVTEPPVAVRDAVCWQVEPVVVRKASAATVAPPGALMG